MNIQPDGKTLTFRPETEEDIFILGKLGMICNHAAEFVTSLGEPEPKMIRMTIKATSLMKLLSQILDKFIDIKIDE